MKFIAVTRPDFIADETRLIEELFACGLDTLHLRKPGATDEACAGLIEALPEACRRRTVVHDHFRLCSDYGLAGVHLNSRNPAAPRCVTDNRERYTVSASCHSTTEAAARKKSTDYVFLSPVFDSISKHGYAAAYTDEELTQAAADGTVDDRVIALGGITANGIPQLRKWHFGGAAFLGDIWNRAGTTGFATHARQLARLLHGDGDMTDMI